MKPFSEQIATPRLDSEFKVDSESIPVSESASELILNTESESFRFDSELPPLNRYHLEESGA